MVAKFPKPIASCSRTADPIAQESNTKLSCAPLLRPLKRHRSSWNEQYLREARGKRWIARSGLWMPAEIVAKCRMFSVGWLTIQYSATRDLPASLAIVSPIGPRSSWDHLTTARPRRRQPLLRSCAARVGRRPAPHREGSILVHS